jgi:regulator of RNase E activity RraA
MESFRFSVDVIDGLLKVSASNVSDACDRLTINGAVRGILPLIPCSKIVGHAATLKLTKSGGQFRECPVNGTLKAIARGGAGAVLVIDGSRATRFSGRSWLQVAARSVRSWLPLRSAEMAGLADTAETILAHKGRK